MTTYVLDWNGNPDGSAYINVDGVNSISNGTGHAVNVTVATPPAPNLTVDTSPAPYTPIEQWYVHNYIGTTDGELVAQYVNDPVTTTISFDTAMTNLTFDIYDIDAGNGWDDLVTIYAIDINGNPTPATITITNSVGTAIVPGTIVAPTTDGVHTVGTDGTNTVIGANGNTAVAVGGAGDPDSVSVSIAGPVYGIVVIYDNGAAAPTSGVVGIGPITFFDPTVWCFARGTMIETDRGEVAIEALMADDMVRTADNGFRPLRWVGSTTVKATGSKAPILFRKGAIGNTQDLLVSPAHRVLLQDWQAEILFGTKELLASAQSLVNDHSIIRHEMEEVEYFHILLDQHEIVFANGAPSESFHPGDADVGTMAQEARDEIFSLFPQLATDQDSYGPAARATLRPQEAALLAL